MLTASEQDSPASTFLRDPCDAPLVSVWAPCTPYPPYSCTDGQGPMHPCTPCTPCTHAPMHPCTHAPMHSLHSCPLCCPTSLALCLVPYIAPRLLAALQSPSQACSMLLPRVLLPVTRALYVICPRHHAPPRSCIVPCAHLRSTWHRANGRFVSLS